MEDERWFGGMFEREDLRRSAPSCCISSLPNWITLDCDVAGVKVRTDDIDLVEVFADMMIFAPVKFRPGSKPSVVILLPEYFVLPSL